MIHWHLLYFYYTLVFETNYQNIENNLCSWNLNKTDWEDRFKEISLIFKFNVFIQRKKIKKNLILHSVM